MTDDGMTGQMGLGPARLYACVRLARHGKVAGAVVDDSMAAGQLRRLAHEFSPRVEVHGAGCVVLDVEGLSRLYGDPRAIGEAVHRSATERHMRVHVAIAATRTSAMLVASTRSGVTVVAAGAEADTLASLPLAALERFHGAEGPGRPGRRDGQGRQGSGRRHYRLAPSPDSRRDDPSDTTRRPEASGAASAERLMALEACRTVRRWGLETLGQVAALPPGELFERLGSVGLELQRLSRGEDIRPLVPDPDTPRFEHVLALEWPIEGLEPLAFALSRVLEPLCRQLERHDRGVAVLCLTLRLVTRETHVRRLELPTPLRDSRVLRTLILLDLESHPPPAGIDEIALAIEPAPGPILQFSLLTRARPVPEQLSTLLARLQALMGDGRCGMPVVVETHRPGGVTVGPFSGDDRPPARATSKGDRATVRATASCRTVVRRCRVPLEIQVQTVGDRPVAVRLGQRGRGGAVVSHAGPWRTSGDWWHGRGESNHPGQWDRDEWDVAVADGGVYRIHRDRAVDRWFLDGLVD